MMTTSFAPFNHAECRQLGLAPADNAVFQQIKIFSSEMGQAFVCGPEFAKRLGYNKKTISRSLGNLIRKGFLKRIGKHLGIFPKVSITTNTDEPAVTERSPTGDQMVTPRCPNGYPELRNKLRKKEQAEISVCSSKNFQIQKKEKLIAQLKEWGMAKNCSKKLITRYGLKKVEEKATHLQKLLERGNSVSNTAGWLIDALRKKYQPTNLERMEPPLEEDRKADQIRKAYSLLQEAQFLERVGKFEEAKRAARESLSHHSLSEAKAIIEKIETHQKQQIARQEAIKPIPKEEFERVLQQKREKQKNIFMKLGITKLGIMGERAAYEAAVDHFQNVAKQVQ